MTSDFIVVANRLPVDRVQTEDQVEWKPSPGGLVTALKPVLQSREGAWVGYGCIDEVSVSEMPSVKEVGVRMLPVNLDAVITSFSMKVFLCHAVAAVPRPHRKSELQ